MADEPFGRQPQPVHVAITGSEQIDVNYWMNQLMQRAEFKGDSVQKGAGNTFHIYPRAVND